jgi:hypothetical protein
MHENSLSVADSAKSLPTIAAPHSHLSFFRWLPSEGSTYTHHLYLQHLVESYPFRHRILLDPSAAQVASSPRWNRNAMSEKANEVGSTIQSG